MAGTFGIRLLSVLGVVVASVCAGQLASRLRPGSGPLALWITGLLSPLVFDSQLIVAHGVAAGLVGAAALVAATADRRSAGLTFLVMAGLAAAAALFRSEAVLLAAAAALVLGAAGLRTGRRSLVASAVGSAVGAGAAFLAEPRWIGSLVDSPDISTKTIAATSRAGLDGRRDAAFRVLVDPSYEGLVEPFIDVALIGAVVLVLVAAALVRAGRVHLATLSVAIAVVLAGVRLTDPTVTPGLLLAFPLLGLAAFLIITGVHRIEAAEACALGIVGLFMAGVLATQYANGGGFEWGWRYVAIALPLITPTIALALDDLRIRIAQPHRSRVFVGVLLVSALVVASGLLEQRAIIDRTDTLTERLETEAATSDHVVFLAPLLGRSMWELSLSGRVVTADVDTATEVLGWVDEAGANDVLLVWGGRPEIPVEPGRFTAGRVRSISASPISTPCI